MGEGVENNVQVAVVQGTLTSPIPLVTLLNHLLPGRELWSREWRASVVADAQSGVNCGEESGARAARRGVMMEMELDI